MASRPLLALLVLGAAIAVVVVLIAVILRRTRRRPEEEAELVAAPPPAPAEPAEPPPPPPPAAPAAAEAPPASSLRRSFRKAMRRLRQHVGAASDRYRVPWFAVLGAAESRPPDLWANAGLNLPFGEPEDYSWSHSGLNWWFFDRGIVLDLGGDYVLRPDGRSAFTAGLKQFLNLLRKHRPQRPLDGVIVTVSCATLLAAERYGTEGLAQLERRADRVYRALWQTQNELDIRFPVYVLLTGAETLEGFDDWSASLPETLGHEIFGWSSPYQLGNAYQSGWVEEGFAALRRRLDHVQLEIYAEQGESDRADGVFTFPVSVARLERPLRVYLDQLFKPSAYHEAILFRGFYLTGDQLLDTAPELADRYLDSPALPRRTLGLKHLLEQKVFPEAALAAPTGSTLLARNRAVRALQAALAVALLVLAFGTVRGWAKLDRSETVFRTVLEESLRDLREVRSIRARGHRPDRELVKQRAKRLFAGMARIDTDRYRSLFLPASWGWVSDFDRRLRRGLSRVFDEIIFDAMLRSLGQRAVDLTTAPPAPHRVAVVPGAPRAVAAPRVAAPRFAARGPVAAVSPPPIDQTAEFLAWARWTREIAELERFAELFNSIHESGDLQDFGAVAGYVFGEEPPREFYDNSDTYAYALKDFDRRFDFERHEQAARRRALGLAHDFYRRITDGSALDLALGLLSEELTTLAAEEWDLDRHVELLTALVETLRWVQDALTYPEYEWVFRSRFALGGEYDELLARTSASRLLGPETAEEIRRDGEAAWTRFRRRLVGYHSQFTGPLLAVEDGRPTMQLSAEVQVFKAALEGFLDQGFMTVAETRDLRPVSPGSQLLWDVPRLEQALTLYEPYQSFRARGLEPFPPDLRTALDAVARSRLAVKLTTAVALAQTFEPTATAVTPLLLEQELRAEIESFGAAAKLLEQVLAIYQELHLNAEYRELAELIGRQGAHLLELVDALLEAEELYRPRRGGFGWWDGAAPVAFAAFEVADEEELNVYLELQRQRIRQLAFDYAQPLLLYLGTTSLHRQPGYRSLYLKWEKIIKELSDYESKKPGNSVAALETYIAETLPEVELGACAQALWQPPGGGRRSDYFRARLAALQRDLRLRCQVLAGEVARARYAELEGFFARRLAGRFPFAAALPEGFGAEAQSADVRAFFRLYDRSIGLLLALGDDAPSLETSGGSATEFLRRMAAVRAFFAPFLDAEEPPPAPVYDFEVEFRVNPGYEREANQIIAWELEAGEQRITHRDAERTGRWSPGAPVALALRWAKDAPRRPAPVAAGRHKLVDERTVRWAYRNRWALLALLRDRASPPQDFVELRDPLPHTLKLVVPTVPDAAVEKTAVAAADGVSPTEVYVRLRLLAPETGEPLVMPVFPARAPELVEPLVTAASGLSPRSSP